jgi:hypothetical protein
MVAPSLSPSDLKDIEAFKTHSLIGRLLVEMRDVWKYAIGDVLVRYKMTENSKDLDLVSDVCPVPKKFRVMYIDDLGIPWIKQLSVRGGLGTKLINLTEAWCNGRYRYCVDQEQIDSILLGYKYDPRIEYRKLRNESPNYGKNKTK